MNSVRDLAVIHLVRASNDLGVLSAFLVSYEKYSAGHAHQLTFLLKGFAGGLPQSVSDLLDRFPHKRVMCPDYGYDIGSYIYASNRIREPLVLFTNSYCVLQADKWLAKFLNAYHQPRVGMVGASGSWESLSSTMLNARSAVSGSILRDGFSKAKALTVGLPLLLMFPAFPNYHIRTNGFLVARKDFLAIRPALMRTKLDAWLFESGRKSMTRRMRERGLEALVVGKDGSYYLPEEWSRSMTFWQSHQENLMIKDNRSIAYDCGSESLRARLYTCAWNCTVQP
jgi:hypothetical protein